MNKEHTILVVDDDQDTLVAAKLLLKRFYKYVYTEQNPEKIPELMKNQLYDVILLDMNFNKGESNGEQGFYWLKKILSMDQEAIVIMITAHAEVSLAVQAIKFGAIDFISKPWENEKVLATVSVAIQLKESRTNTKSLKQSNNVLIEASHESKQTLLGSSKAMNNVHSLISRAAPTDANVLILGENGTGKELVAREIHQQSLRANEIFMSVDLGAISESLFESELFGHTKGSFTGANQDRIGRFIAAHKGTLFLDEIGNIPLHLQAKLLTVLEQRKVTRLGTNTLESFDVRIIAATNVPKEELLNEQKFRQDLLYRLNTVEIEIPPLRDRAQDILEIATYYAHFYAKKYRKSVKLFSKDAIERAKKDKWAGNIRALRHAVERAVILSQGEEYNAADLQLSNEVSYANNTTSDISEDLHLERLEKKAIESALNKHGYNISKAAKDLGLTRASLYRRMEKHGI